LGRDGLEGSFAAFELQGRPVGAANVPYSEGMGALMCHRIVIFCILIFFSVLDIKLDKIKVNKPCFIVVAFL
jgi:hypothetical protein